VAEPLRRTVRVRCELDHAFQVFTERVDLWWPEGHRRFADSRLVLEARVGGRFVELAATGEEAKLGEVLSCEPPHSISYTWYPGAISKPTRVDVRFATEGNETVVSVEHSEADSELGEAWRDRVVLFERGWHRVLEALKSHAEGDSGATFSS